MKSRLSALLTKAEPLLLAWAANLLRHYLGLGKSLWVALNAEIDRLDRNKTLSNEDRHKLAVSWLREKMAIPDQLNMPRHFMQPDWEGRAIQLVCLIRRLRAWLHPEPVI
jgi:hypothetical protein